MGAILQKWRVSKWEIRRDGTKTFRIVQPLCSRYRGFYVKGGLHENCDGTTTGCGGLQNCVEGEVGKVCIFRQGEYVCMVAVVFHQSRRSILCKGDLNENVDVQLKKCVEVKLISTYFGVEAYCNTKLLPCQQCIIFAFSFFLINFRRIFQIGR